MTSLRVGLIGTGVISGAYLGASRYFPQLEIVSCAELNPAAARKRAKEFGIKAQTVEALLDDGSIDLAVNLTTPQSHVAINRQAIAAGKHLYCEKPFGLTTEEAAPVLDEARARGVRVGCAPDTFLSDGQEVPSVHPFGDRDYRGIGVADLVQAVADNRPHRASGQLAFHVLEVMQAIVENASSGESTLIGSTCDRPAPIQAVPALGTLQ
jgi:Oxidoreductase family, NAD-binding Rossmann fold